jgi:hypothetical protein
MFSTQKHMELAAKAYKELQTLSLKIHHELIKKSSSESLILKPGWLKLFKTDLSFQKYSSEINILNKNKVDYKVLSTSEIMKMVPELQVKFAKGVLFKNSIRVNSPLKLSKEPCDTPSVEIKKKQTIVINEVSEKENFFDNMIAVITNRKKIPECILLNLAIFVWIL